jgi:hypothetical protein
LPPKSCLFSRLGMAFLKRVPKTDRGVRPAGAAA